MNGQPTFRLVEPVTELQYGATEAIKSLRYPENLTLPQLMEELRRQPHLAPLEQALAPEKNFYLLYGGKQELLLMAATYIGAYYALHHRTELSEIDPAVTPDGDDDEYGDEDGDGGTADSFSGKVRLDPVCQLPLINAMDIPSEDIGHPFGGCYYEYMPKKPPLPWWLRHTDYPLCIASYNFVFSDQVLRVSNNRPLTILCCFNPQEAGPGCGNMAADEPPQYAVSHLSFELECIPIRLEDPAPDSPYKRQILRQCFQARNAPPPSDAEAKKIIHIVESVRGNADNATLNKAAGNAILHRPPRRKGPFTARDLQYLLDMQFRVTANTAGIDEETLVGQEEVRRQLTAILDAFTFQKQRKKAGLPETPMHLSFAFLGAPGTGKTTWAKWLGSQLQKRGILQNDSMIAINAAELKAKYVGHTTGRVKHIFDEYGIILLDEAYSLTDGPDGGDAFGREALSQLCVELEEHAGDRLVVFAGYGGKDGRDSPMGRFFQANPGIASRVGFKVYFEDMTPAQLAEVYCSMLHQRRFQLPEETAAHVEDFFRRRVGAKAFGNCREARNLADRTLLHMAHRLSGNTAHSAKALCQVTLADVDASIRELLDESRHLAMGGGSAGTAIGF